VLTNINSNSNSNINCNVNIRSRICSVQACGRCTL
jgi:hypothetical protein